MSIRIKFNSIMNICFLNSIVNKRFIWFLLVELNYNTIEYFMYLKMV